MSGSTFQIPHHRKSIAAAAVLDDQRLIVSVTRGNSIFVIRLADGAELGRWKGHRSAGYAIAVSPCRKFVATGDCNGVIRLWTSKGTSLHQLGRPGWFQRCGGPLIFSADSRQLIIRRESDFSSWGDTLWQIDTKSFEEQILMDWIQLGVQDLRLSSDGQQLFAATDFGEISSWTMSPRFGKRKRIRIQVPLKETQLHPAMQSQSTLVVRDPPDSKEPFDVRLGHIDYIASLALAGLEQTAVAWGKLIVVYRLNGRQRKQVGYFEATSGRLTKLLESDQENHIWSLDDSGRVTHWNLDTRSAVEQFESRLNGPQIMLANSEQSTLVVAAGRNVRTISR